MAVKTFNIARPPSRPAIGIYGENGAGKTTMVADMPGIGVYIDVPMLEGGGFVLPREAAPRIAGIKVEEWEDLESVYWGLKDRNPREIVNEANPDWDVRDAKWFAMDSATALHVLATRKIIRERDRSLGEDPHKITLQERGWISQLEAEMFFRFRSLDDYWQLYVAQQRTHRPPDDSPDPEPIRIGPDLPGGALRAFKQPLTIIGHLAVVSDKKGNEQRQLRVGPPDGDYIVKARTPRDRRLPQVIAEPDLSTILRYVFASKIRIPANAAKLKGLALRRAIWKANGIKEVKDTLIF